MKQLDICVIFLVQIIIYSNLIKCQTNDSQSCKDDEFECSDFICIPKTKLCDGKFDCFLGDDEIYELCENTICNITQFHCASGGCIPISNVCNRVMDCSDGSDESDCRTPEKCSNERMVACLSGECIESYQICDGIKDCPDSSDETALLCSTIHCPAYLFTCKYGACVDPEGVCNGVPDCVDYSDELLPRCMSNLIATSELICGKSHFRCNTGLCIKSDKLCDGIRDCEDGSDETYRQCKNEICAVNEHKCSYGACSRTGKCVSFGSPKPSHSTSRPINPVTEPVTEEDFQCYYPRQPRNGVMKTNTGVQYNVSDVVPEWTILIYKCNEGYSLGEEQSVLVCMNNQWTNPFPRCFKICPALKSEKHIIECFHSGKAIDCDKAYEGATANIKCKEAFEVKNFVFQPYNGINCESTGLWNNELFDCNPQCGTLIPKGQALVIKGFTPSKGEFPWHAGIYSRDTIEDDYEQHCGGTLLTERIVLSAAHCFWDWKYNKPNIDVDKHAVAVGKLYRNWNNTEDPHAQYCEIQRIILPKRFRAVESSFSDDIAIIILNNTVKLNAVVRPVCIDWSTELYKTLFKPGALGVVAGWGLTEEFGIASNELQAVKMTFIDYDTCLNGVPDTFRPFITSDKICAGYNNGTSLCTGDSGGGLAFKRSNRYFIGGVVSVSPAKGTTCDAYKYVAFTSIPAHINFITKVERGINNNSTM